MLAGILAAAFILVELGFLARSLLRPHRDPAARLAWVVVLLALPVAGWVAYLLFGETNVGRRRIVRIGAAAAALPAPTSGTESVAEQTPAIPGEYRPVFRVGQSINGNPPLAGNRAALMTDSDAGIAAMVADIDAAREHVHVLFDIWCADPPFGDAGDVRRADGCGPR